MSTRISANQREVISAVSTLSNSAEYLSSTSNRLNVNATLSGSGTVLGDVRVTDGTNVANTLKSDGTAAGQNAQFTAPAYWSTGTLTLTLASNSTQWFDLGNYPGISLEVLSNSSAATLTFQTSGDASQTNVRSNVLQDSNTTIGSAALSTTSAVASYYGNRAGRYFRVTSNVSGANTASIVLTFYTTPLTLSSLGVQAAQSGTWTVGSNSATGSAFPANAFGNGVKALMTSPTAASTGNLVAATGNTMGESLVTTGGLVTTSVPTNAANVVIKGSAGRLCRVLVTTTGSTAMQIFDNATTNTGTLIGVLPASAAIGGVYDFSMPAANGITIAGSATNPAVTVSWI